MAAETGHFANRTYTDQSGDFHTNGASFFDANENDIAAQLDKLNGISDELDALTGEAALTGSAEVAADELVIPVTAKVVDKTTGADAEALTLADGAYDGQELTIVLTTDGGGDGTLTPATSTGWATIVFADAGDTAHLKFIDSTVGWVIVGLSGVAAPPAMTV